MKTKEKKSSDKHSFAHVTKNVWFMFKYTFKYTPGYIWVTLIEAFGRGFWHVLGILYIKYLFDAIERGVSFGEVLIVSLLVAGYNGLFELFNKWMLYVYRPKANLALHRGMQGELFLKAKDLDQSCYDDPAFFNDFVWASRESDSRTVSMMVDLSIFLNRVVSSVVIFGVLVTMDWIVAVVLLISLLFGFKIKIKLNKAHYDRSNELNPIGRKLGYIGRIFYLPDYAKELRQGQIADHLREQYSEVTKEKIACVKKHSWKLFGLTLLNSFLTNALPHAGVTGYLIVRYLLDSSLSLGSFSASINATLKLYWTINDIGNYFTKFNEHSLYVERFRNFIGYEPTITGEEENVPEFESLTVRGLRFVYPFSSNGNDVLKNIDIEIKKGEKIAFVGYNGAGKTTLIKLLMRLYDPADGDILYNGINIREYAPEAYREHIGAVFQDYKIFAATIAENVLGREYTDADEPIVRKALAAASFEEKLAELPNGIHTHLTREFQNDGVGLSGGETQKIAIARAFAHPYEIIIMDEPSSALDPVAEYELNRSILNSSTDKAVIFISHRLSTTRMADRIYMFDEGEIAECGTHDELMNQNGKYAEMYRVQAEKYM